MTFDMFEKLGPVRLSLAGIAVLSAVLLVAGVLPAGLFIPLIFILTGTWVVLWMRDTYEADRKARAEFYRRR